MSCLNPKKPHPATAVLFWALLLGAIGFGWWTIGYVIRVFSDVS